MNKQILSGEEIKAFLDDLLGYQYAGKEIDKLVILLGEAEAIIRKDERGNIALWLEHSNEIATKQEAAKQLRGIDALKEKTITGIESINKRIDSIDG